MGLLTNIIKNNKNTMSKKYAGYNEKDTFWDEHHRKTGQMTNREFFSSNDKGGFYEGMDWDGKEWVPNAETTARQTARDAKKCQECGCENCCCW